MDENSSGSDGRTRLRVSVSSGVSSGTPSGRRRGLDIRWILVLVVLGIFAWMLRGQIGNLVFARGGSSTRPAGEWVGQMVITGDYDVATHSVKLGETQRSSAVVYMKLEGTDSFMNEFGGVGEIVLKGDPTRRPVHVGAVRLADDGRVTSGTFDSANLTTGIQGTFSPGAFHLKNYGPTTIVFTMDLRRGNYHTFQAVAEDLH